VGRLRTEMSSIGVDLGSDDETHYGEAAIEPVRSRPLKRKREDSEGRVRSSSKIPRDMSGIRDAKTRKKVKAMSKKAQTGMNRNARKGEGDRHIPDQKPKHLYCGKRGMGKNDIYICGDWTRKMKHRINKTFIADTIIKKNNNSGSTARGHRATPGNTVQNLEMPIPWVDSRARSQRLTAPPGSSITRQSPRKKYREEQGKKTKRKEKNVSSVKGRDALECNTPKVCIMTTRRKTRDQKDECSDTTRRRRKTAAPRIL